MKTEKEFHDENEFDPFGKPLQPRFLEPSLIKSVFCGYEGRLIVYDIHGKKVHELSGMITYDKYVEIEKRSNPDITEITGLEEYRCIACELKAKQQKEQHEEDEDAGFKMPTPRVSMPTFKVPMPPIPAARASISPQPQPSSSKPPLLGQFGPPVNQFPSTNTPLVAIGRFCTTTPPTPPVTPPNETMVLL